MTSLNGVVHIASQGSGAKKKGASYELKTAKALSLWWGFTFQRTPGSGSLHWSAENNVAGDIVAGPSSGFPFVVECKNQEGGWTIESLLLKNVQMSNWWAQVVSDSRRVERIPLLMFTRNRAKDFVMIPYDEEIYHSLILGKHEVMRTIVTIKDELTLKTESFDVMVFLYSGLTSFKPEFFIKKYKKYNWEAKTLVKFPNEQTEEVHKSAEDLANDMIKKLKP